MSNEYLQDDWERLAQGLGDLFIPPSDISPSVTPAMEVLEEAKWAESNRRYWRKRSRKQPEIAGLNPWLIHYENQLQMDHHLSMAVDRAQMQIHATQSNQQSSQPADELWRLDMPNELSVKELLVSDPKNEGAMLQSKQEVQATIAQASPQLKARWHKQLTIIDQAEQQHRAFQTLNRVARTFEAFLLASIQLHMMRWEREADALKYAFESGLLSFESYQTTYKTVMNQRLDDLGQILTQMGEEAVMHGLPGQMVNQCLVRALQEAGGRYPTLSRVTLAQRIKTGSGWLGDIPALRAALLQQTATASLVKKTFPDINIEAISQALSVTAVKSLHPPLLPKIKAIDYSLPWLIQTSCCGNIPG